MADQKSRGGQKEAHEREMAGKKRRRVNTKAFQQHDIKGRLGGFGGAGNHPRTGNRGHQ